MGGTNFFDLFSSLHKSELTAFGKHLRTAHAHKEIELAVFAQVKKFHPSASPRRARNDDRLAAKVFGTDAAARKKLHNSYHDLYCRLKEFLLLQKVADRSMESEWLWLSVLRQRKVEAEHGRASRRLLSNISAGPKKNTADYLLALAADYWTYSQDPVTTEKHLRAVSESLDVFYKICRQKIDSEILNWQKQGTTGMAVSQYLPAGAETPLSHLYGGTRQLLCTSDPEVFRQLGHGLRRYAAEVGQKELYTVWQNLKNHCAAQIRNGKKNFCHDAHELDKFALDQGLLLSENGLMSGLQFLNIVTAALVVGAVDWVGQFVENHRHHLDPQLRAEVAVVSGAMLFFKAGKFAKALAELQKFEEYRSKEEAVEMRRRAYTLLCLYELKAEPEEQFRQITSFYRFLERSRSPRKSLTKATKHFLLIFQSLLYRKKDAAKIREAIKAAKPLAFGAWLLEKTEHYGPVK